MGTDQHVSHAEEPRCSLPSCYCLHPKLYDERIEQYFCDIDCLTEFIAENPDSIAEWYAKMNIQIIEEDEYYGS